MSTETLPPPRTAPEFDSDADPASRMSFGDHLEELRSCVIRALLGFLISAVIALLVGKQILAVIFAPLLSIQAANGIQPRLQALSPTDVFSAYLRMSILAGAIFAMPWMLYQLWRFVSSGLYAHERRFVKRLTVASGGLFLAGVVFLYFLVLPIVLQFFITFNRTFESQTPAASIESPVEPVPEGTPGIGQGLAGPATLPLLPGDPPQPRAGDAWVNMQTKRIVVSDGERLWSAPLSPGAVAPAIESQFAIPAYISFVLMLALAFGIAFETPIVVVFLAWSNLVDVATMAGARRYVIMIIVVLAAVMTPPDVISQMMLAVPMYGLFELGLFLARSLERSRSPA